MRTQDPEGREMSEPLLLDVPANLPLVLAIDPGTHESAMLGLSEGGIGERTHCPNDKCLEYLRAIEGSHIVAVEMVACYGMAVGKEVFETCLVIGRIQEICAQKGWPCRLVYRRDVKLWLCGSMKAKDGNIRQALIDKYGPPGTKKAPGFTYGISSHLWSALAIADFARNNPQP